MCAGDIFSFLSGGNKAIIRKIHSWVRCCNSMCSCIISNWCWWLLFLRISSLICVKTRSQLQSLKCCGTWVVSVLFDFCLPSTFRGWRGHYRILEVAQLNFMCRVSEKIVGCGHLEFLWSCSLVALKRSQDAVYARFYRVNAEYYMARTFLELTFWIILKSLQNSCLKPTKWNRHGGNEFQVWTASLVHKSKVQASSMVTSALLSFFNVCTLWMILIVYEKTFL